jgi:hypothetical protein
MTSHIKANNNNNKYGKKYQLQGRFLQGTANSITNQRSKVVKPRHFQKNEYIEKLKASKQRPYGRQRLSSNAVDIAMDFLDGPVHAEFTRNIDNDDDNVINYNINNYKETNANRIGDDDDDDVGNKDEFYSEEDHLFEQQKNLETYDEKEAAKLLGLRYYHYHYYYYYYYYYYFSGSMSLSHEVDMARKSKINPRHTFPAGFKGSNTDTNTNINTADVVAQGWRTIRNGWTATFDPPTKPVRKSRSAHLLSKSKKTQLSSSSSPSSSPSPKMKTRSLSPSLSPKSTKTATVVNSKKCI